MTENSAAERLRPAGMTLGEWFLYADRERHNPSEGARVTTHGFHYSSRGSREAGDWEQDEWLISSVLVRLDDGGAALQRAASDIRADQVDFRPHWEDLQTFDFGESSYIGDVEVSPWLHIRKHPLTDQLIVDARADFLRYHCLDRRDAGDGADYGPAV